jgi:predicted alpha/beta-fold hydrolase
MGCMAVVVNYRGTNVELLTPRLFSTSSYDDFELVVNHVRRAYPNHKLFAVGTSLGGIQLGNYLTKSNQNENVSYAMIVSASLNYKTTHSELEKCSNRIINWHITREMKKIGQR